MFAKFKYDGIILLRSGQTIAKELIVIKWYIVSVTPPSPAKDVTVRVQLNQELVSALNLGETVALRQLTGMLRSRGVLKLRNINDLDINVEEDEDQSSHTGIRSV